jgi:hypothetical protein
LGNNALHTTIKYRRSTDNTVKRSGQNWTVDLLVAVVIFLSVSIFFYSAARQNLAQDTSFDNSADNIVNRLDAANYPANYNQTSTPINGYSLTESELETFYSEDYATIKQRLGVQKDFCILIVRPDGAIVRINASGTDKYSVGDPDGPINITSDMRCGT